MLFLITNLILFFLKTETLFFSINNNYLYIECGRAIIIKNHYWFLSEFLHLLKSFDRNQTINYHQIPFDHLYLIFHHILIHCHQAHYLSQRNKKNSNLDQFYHWLQTQMKN